MRTTDNNCGKSLEKIASNEPYNIDDLRRLANIRLSEIKLDDYPNLLVFPRNWNEYKDDINKSVIFTLSNDKILATRNIMGFIGLNDTNLTITSRFSEENNSDYFLHYMLKKVMAINLLELKHHGGKNDIWNFLPFFFPYFLNKAFSQGMYKEYKRNEYNDTNVHGVIDVKRHLRVNTFFSGKIAYSVKEYSCNNPVMQIVRHTIECIKNSQYRNILTNDDETFSNVNQVIYATSEYSKNNRQKIIDINKKKSIVHPYFTEYKALQRLCIRILTNEKISTNNEKEKIHGILFDGAWLWEEYLNTILAEKGFIHPRNKTGEGRCYLFKNSKGKKTNSIYPDFINKELSIIADAKYKRIEPYIGIKYEDQGINGFQKDNFDFYQLITYMYRFNSNKGILIFPYSGEKDVELEEKTMLKGFEDDIGESKVIVLGMKIPRYTTYDNFSAFQREMETAEINLKNSF